MNLIKCEACGHDVSPAAAACANCGHPLPKQKRLGCAIAAFVVGIIGIVTITIATHYGEENQRQE
jgi:uncharacterized protein (DUF983 family)